MYQSIGMESINKVEGLGRKIEGLFNNSSFHKLDANFMHFCRLPDHLLEHILHKAVRDSCDLLKRCCILDKDGLELLICEHPVCIQVIFKSIIYITSITASLGVYPYYFNIDCVISYFVEYFCTDALFDGVTVPFVKSGCIK